MSLDEYKRKRRFEATPEPPPKVEKKSQHRFVVQRHDATRLHYDFRLEMEGVLKSWAVPKGPSLDPADKRLAMQVEDHPVSYFDFEGTIPEGNYGAGTVMVWDLGTWEPLSPVPVNGEYVPGTEKEAAAMLAKGDLKFRLQGKRLVGDFALVHIKARRPVSKGNEWLLIKKKDGDVVAGFDVDAYETSVLTNRTMKQIAGDAGSAEWTSSRLASRGKVKAAWLADAIARADSKRKVLTAESAEGAEKKKSKGSTQSAGKIVRVRTSSADTAPKGAEPKSNKKTSANSASSAVKALVGAEEKPMPTEIRPMLATTVEKAFDNPDWLFEIKWDGYRAIAFIEDGRVRLVSRTQNDLMAQFRDLSNLPEFIKAERAILDGEIVALDEEGRPSFSLMQQRTGFQPGKRRLPGREGVQVVYYAFDLLYLDGFDLRRVVLEQRKRLLQEIIKKSEIIHFSDHYPEKGMELLEAARQRALEGIVAKKRNGIYEEKRSRDWLKIKITQRQECVIGGYTPPEGSREYFGALVLGLYDAKRRLIHVGQVGTGFDHAALKAMFELIQPLKTKENPFFGEIGGLKKVQFVRPSLVAEIKFSEWTHETSEGGTKLRAPVFMGLREDKTAEECRLEEAVAS
ncbi:MAG TPA: non-homologous end-joining DNA ligase [Terriglobales bacterium]|jgi:bifunctional non-homologous end joining protein LigD|nr:non-homologous end-joining DNA ligase [Terriglobales bacterium]